LSSFVSFLRIYLRKKSNYLFWINLGGQSTLCSTKFIKFGLKIIFIYLASIIKLNYSIPFSICHNTTQRKELFSLKGITFAYVLIATGPCIANQLRDVNTICRRSWYIAAHVWKIYDFKIEVVPFMFDERIVYSPDKDSVCSKRGTTEILWNCLLA
jgi:hypothetical protein